MKSVLLPLGDYGEPLQSSQGTLLLNSYPGASEYHLKLLISGASPVTNDGSIWTTVSPKGTESSRNKFYEHKITKSLHKDSFIDLYIYKPGVYSCKASYRDEDSDNTTNSKEWFFVVQPCLELAGEYLPLNSISIQSVVSKWMGPLSSWKNIFNVISNKGYNMIHFTPLQYRGDSNSPYSIRDQLVFDPDLFSSEKDVQQLVSSMKSDHHLLALTDVVWNHTANNSDWLRDHPEAGYSQETAPHLISAMELDEELLEFSNSLVSLGYPDVIGTISDLDNVMDGIRAHVINKLKLWEFYIINVASVVKELESFLQSNPYVPTISLSEDQTSSISALAKFTSSYCVSGDTLGARFGKKVDIRKLASVLVSYKSKSGVHYIEGKYDTALIDCGKRLLDEINMPFYKVYDADVAVIISQLFNRIKYLRLDDHGPKLGRITLKNPLTEPYFTRFKSKEGKDVALANNGWVWNGNPLVDFASSDSKAYLRREVIIWGDCVKLRYGSKREDSPYLWDRMIQYTKLCAKIFDGFRIDNCHSTPLHVGEALIDAAREVNPNIYVVAELFSGSEELDRLFVERLGICSLLREAMQAWSEQELSRVVHKHAGHPIGSLKWLPLDDFSYPSKKAQALSASEKASEIDVPTLLTYQEPHALFMDCTHDNETPAQRRTVEDTLPNAALVGLSSCAVGSVFGYDECYPKLLDVVNEKRIYYYGDNGIGHVKHQLYKIRDDMSRKSLAWEDHEMYLHHEGQYITLHRINAKTGEGVFLVARTKFSENGGDQKLAPITFTGGKAEHLFGYTLQKVSQEKESDDTIEPIPVKVVELQSPLFHYNSSVNETIIELQENFPQGSITVFKTQYTGINEELDQYLSSGAIDAASELSLHDLNAVLYKCDAEERDSSDGHDGVYNIPGHGELVYAGLQGWISAIKPIIRENNLGHPFCENIRQGSWSSDYVVQRLVKYSENSKGITKFLDWLKTRMDIIKTKIPFFLRPKYFALVLGIGYEACRFQAVNMLSPMFSHSTLFVQDLGLTSIQMNGYCKSGSLDPFKLEPSMAAGLPHFSTSWARCWGRDIFISLRGLLLVTGRFDDAKKHILAAGSSLKHGLIPNLIDNIRRPRYNARDATWFWLQSIQDYIEMVPKGEAILEEKIKRRFPLDDRYIEYDDPEAFSYEMPLKDIIYEVFQRHAKGMEFREANAGPGLDMQMKEEGFNIKVKVDWANGIIFGGSQWNCGTWMDKMGESEKAGNKGFPGTPRDGAAIEITGLMKSALRFVIDLNKKGLFEYVDVVKADGSKITFVEWDKLVQEKFEYCYYIPKDPQDDKDFDVNPSIVNRRGIYKDLYKSGKEYEDYQLRANFPIAMVVAPELFTPERATGALHIADEVIRGPVGMKTLDPSDYNYRPYYINSEDSGDFATAKGRNYHQGPEWVWLTGYFLRAYALFYKEGEAGKKSELHRDLMRKLKGHKKWITDSPWRGLTELTNKSGETCNDSSPTQAWSTGCLIDLFYDRVKHEE